MSRDETYLSDVVFAIDQVNDCLPCDIRNDVVFIRQAAIAAISTLTWSEHAEPKCQWIAVNIAKDLLAEIKKHESEGK